MARRAALLACAVLAFAPAARAAGFGPLQGPPGAVSLFAASGSAWVAVTEDYPPHAFVSRDGAASWQPVAINGVDSLQSADGLSVGPDGAFYLSVSASSGLALVRMTAAGSSFERVPAALPAASPDATLGAPAWDAQGRMWIAIGDSRTLTLGRVAPDGSFQDAVSAQANTYEPPRTEFVGGKLYVKTAGDVFQLAAGVLRSIQGGSGQYFDNWPVMAAGSTVLTSGGLSLDGGASFGSRESGIVLGVNGTQSVFVVQGFQGENGGRVFTRFSPAIYRPSGLTVPDNTTDVWQTQRGLVALTKGTTPGLSLQAGAIPDLAVDGRGISATARAMLARANYYRRQAGLPPILGDRLIAQASLNHARYWAGRALPRGHLLDVHSETPGTRGFTGRSPEERCMHVGGDCGSEVMNFGNQALHPVDSWVATPYHRGPFIDPGVVSAGAARVGRIGVMDFSFKPQNVVMAPVEFPRGSYRGPLVFPGNETPDPLAACRAVHQPLGSSPSIPVSFVPPVVVSKSPVVQLFRGRARVPGCTKVGFFMGRSQLAPRARYRVEATWTAAAGGRPVTTTWTFRTG